MLTFQPDHVRRGNHPVWQIQTAHCDSRLTLEVAVVTDPDNGPLVVIEHGLHVIVLDDIEPLITALRAARFARGQRVSALDIAATLAEEDDHG